MAKMNHDELTRASDAYLKLILSENTTSDPTDSKGALVDQNINPQPISNKIIFAIDAYEAQELRMANLVGRQESLSGLEIRYAPYVDKNLFRAPRSVFSGPRHPWHFFWAEDYEKGRDGMQPLTEPAQQALELLIFKGYRPADFRKLEPLFVTGNDAALLACSRRPNVIQALAAKKPPVPPPPPLPQHLWDKFGMLMSPTVNRKDGTLWIGRQRLYIIERQIVDTQRIQNRRAANGDMHIVGNGITREPGALQGVAEIDLDTFFPR